MVFMFGRSWKLSTFNLNVRVVLQGSHVWQLLVELAALCKREASILLKGMLVLA
jgi:hypothetical protein